MGFEQRLEVELEGLPPVILRRFSREDSQALYEAAAESLGHGFSEWMPWCHARYKLVDSVAFVESRAAGWDRGSDYSFVVSSPEGRFLGGAGLNAVSLAHRWCNLGYWVRRSEWGKGYAVAATLAVARFAFEQLKLHRVELVIATANTKSHRVAEKAGALYEGTLRNRLVLHGTVHDARLYSLIPNP